jgi:hypothetical protein
MNSDPVIDEVRSARRKISASYGHDVGKMIADHMKQQERYADRLVMPGQMQSRRKPSRLAAKKHTALVA